MGRERGSAAAGEMHYCSYGDGGTYVGLPVGPNVMPLLGESRAFERSSTESCSRELVAKLGALRIREGPGIKCGKPMTACLGRGRGMTRPSFGFAAGEWYGC